MQLLRFSDCGVTIGAGALLGMVGLALAAPLASAAGHIANERRDAGAAPAVREVTPVGG